MNKVSAPPSPKTRSKPPLRHRLHRLLGVTTGVVLLHLVVSGLPLQFTDSLNLVNRHITSPQLLDWYGLQAPESATRSGALVHIGERLYSNSRLLGNSREFTGAVSTPDFEVALTGSSLWLIPADTSIGLEQLAIGRQAKAIGLYQGRVVIDTGSGLHELDDALLNLQESPAPAADVQWASLELLQGPALVKARTDYRNGMLNVERLLQDLHSGRLFGTVGIWVVNGGTLLLFLLAISGYLIWWRGR